MQALNAAGYRTVTPDLPGLGRSDKPSDLAAYNVQTSITPAMVALVDALKLDKFSVVGHDFGAGPAWGIAFMCPDRVERVLVLSVGYFGECEVVPSCSVLQQWRRLPCCAASSAGGNAHGPCLAGLIVGSATSLPKHSGSAVGSHSSSSTVRVRPAHCAPHANKPRAAAP